MNFPFAPPSATLEHARLLASARYSPRPVPWISPLIGGSVVVLFAALVAMAFFRQGLLAWSAGLVYIFYDTVLLVFTGWQTRGLAVTPAQTRVTASCSPTLAVIIAAHNEERAIRVTVDALLVQTDLPDLILIADDGSTDGTAALLAAHYGLALPDAGELSGPSPAIPRLCWLRVPHGGKARALNAALAHVTCDIVLTVDADTLLESHAIAAMRASFASEPALVAATGVLTPVCGRSAKARFFQWFQTYEYVRNFLSRYAWMQLNGLLLISGAFAAFRREALVAVGGFDPDCLVEDYELIHRLHRWSAEHGHGWTVRVIGGARARTDAPETLMAFLRQRRRWFAGFLQTQRWNRDMTGNPAFGTLGTRMMPVKALDTLQPIYGLTAFALLIGFVAAGRYALALPILLVMIAKVIVDLCFHLWSLRLYQRWTGDHQSKGAAQAVLAAILEPFSFQLMRHAGAAWGWWTFLTGQHSWGRQSRGGIMAQVE
jgi:cellulose synthase/poly-beta-1,6-N-acetylglucosamine synthase-like glycosyltransferase